MSTDNRIILKDTGPNNPLRFKLEVTEQFAKVFFSASEWNSMVRQGLVAGGIKWINEYLPLRFGWYASEQLGYHAVYHRDHGQLPLVVTGNLEQVATSQSWADAIATSSTQRLDLHITTGLTPARAKSPSVPYTQQPLVYQTLTAITERELSSIAMQMQTTIMGLLEGADVSVSRKGTVRGALTPTQRAGLSKTSRSNLSTHTARAA